MPRPRNRNYKIIPGAEPAIDALKYEVAKNLGIAQEIDAHGWTGLRTIDAGNLGGAITQILTELGQMALIQLHQQNRIAEVARLFPGTSPEKADLTRTRLAQFDNLNLQNVGAPNAGGAPAAAQGMKPQSTNSNNLLV